MTDGGSGNINKGILLVGGAGTRLHPVTKAVNKHLLPIYNKPMVYYSMSTLMLAGVSDVLLITTPADISSFERLFGDGSQFGIHITYAAQYAPRGIAEAFVIGKPFIGFDPVILALGDNIFYGHGFQEILLSAVQRNNGATILVHHVSDPHRFGIAELDGDKVVSLEEKPTCPKSNLAIVGLYFYDNSVIDIAADLKPSKRGELEITDVNIEYLRLGKLRAEQLGRGFAWLDTGTYEAMIDASSFIATIEKRQGLRVACLEEIAFLMGRITKEQFLALARASNDPYLREKAQII